MFPPQARVRALAAILAVALALAAITAWLLVGRPRRAAPSGAPAWPARSSSPARSPATTPSPATGRGCRATPGGCGFPGAASTGLLPGTALRKVPGQVSSGQGWSFRPSTHSVEVTGRGAVLSGLAIAGNLDIAASDVTVRDDRIVTAGTFGISLRHTSGVTIEHTTVRGANATTGRVDYAIDDIYGDSTGLVIRNDNISRWRVGINAQSGLVTGNYIHDPGYVAGDHTDGIYVSGGTRPLIISDNTVLNRLGQTCAIMLESAAGQPVADKAIVGNLLAGGDYAVYAAGAQRDSTRIVIRGNRFGRQFYPASGRYGPVTQFQADGAGNIWSGNIWSGNAWTGSARPSDISSRPVPGGRADIIPAP
jgi:hypothetical protein